MTSRTDLHTVVVFTDSFPFCGESERTFMLPELKAAAAVFERVVVVPTVLKAEAPGADGLPANVEVDLSWARSAAGRSRAVRAMRIADPRTWLTVRGDISRSGLTFGAAARAMSAWLAAWIRRRGFDLRTTLFYSFWFDIAAAALALTSRRLPLRFISGGHGFDVFTTRGGALRRLMADRAEAVYVASESARAFLVAQFPEHEAKIAARRLGCVKLFPDVLTRSHSVADHRITVLSVSNVVPVKRVDLNARLMRGLALAREGSQVHWIHVGDGPELDTLRRRLESERMPRNFSWELRGSLGNEAVHRIYRDETIDWFLTLSLREGGNPVAVCEAMAYGVPPVVTDTTGLAEMVGDDCGIVMPVDLSREEFVRGMLPYIDSDVRSAAMRCEAARRWASDFDASRLRGEFFNSIVNG